MQVTDEMVRAGALACRKRQFDRTGAGRAFDATCPPTDNELDNARATITAALAAMWRPIEEAPSDRPAMYGYRTQFGEWYQYRFEHPTIPQQCGYTHYAEMLPSPPKAEG